MTCSYGHDASVALSRIDVPDQITPRPSLSPSAWTASRALAEAIFSTRSGPPPGERVTWLIEDLDHFLAHAGQRARLSYGLCLMVSTWLAPLLKGRLGSLGSLAIPERIEALEHLEKSPLALALFGAKTILCILYYEHPEAAAAAGVDPSCLRSSS